MQNFEQMMNLYHGIFIGCGIAAIVFLVLAVVAFILLKIPRVFGELSGHIAKKAIQEMESGSAESGSLTSRKIGDDGRRHRGGKGRTGALGTSRLRKHSGSLNVSIEHNTNDQISNDITDRINNVNTNISNGETGNFETSKMNVNKHNYEQPVINQTSVQEEKTIQASDHVQIENNDTQYNYCIKNDSYEEDSETIVLNAYDKTGFQVIRSIVMVNAEGVDK